MRYPQYHSQAQHLQAQVLTVLLVVFAPADYSARCTAVVLLTCMLLAAARRLSLAAVAAIRRGSPCRETLRQALYATLPDYHGLCRRLYQVLRASLPRGLLRHPGRRRYPMALDVHRVAYYKRGRTPPEHVRKGQALRGTHYAHDYASLCILRKGQYYTVALTPCTPGESHEAIVRRLLPQAARLGFRPRYLLLDRSFWSAELFRYLQRARVPFAVPVLPRGKKADRPGGPTGTRVFLHGHASGAYSYRLHNRNKTQHATVTIWVQRQNHAGRRGKHGRYAWAYGTWKMDLSSARALRERYRRRFRIESSYRLLETGRGRTSTRDEGLRLWYVVLALLLANAWLQLRWQTAPSDEEDQSAECWCVELLAVLGQVLLEGTPPPQPAASQARPAQGLVT
jgi:putative transposase